MNVGASSYLKYPSLFWSYFFQVFSKCFSIHDGTSYWLSLWAPSNMISPALLALSLAKNNWAVLLLVESLPFTLNFLRTFYIMSSSSAPLNPDSLAGPDCPIDSKTAEFSVSLGFGAWVVVDTVVVVDPSLF